MGIRSEHRAGATGSASGGREARYGAIVCRIRTGWLPPRPTPVPADVVEALNELGIHILRVDGREANARCVAHLERVGKEDRHPSWSCNTETGVFHCFSCGWKGPFVLLVTEVLGVTWDEAVLWIRQRGGIERVNRILGRGKYEPGEEEIREASVITEADLALFTAPPQEARRKRGLSLPSCEKYGVLWDPARDMWIFPIRDKHGKLLGWQEKNERHFRNKPFSVEKGRTLFGYHLLPQGGTAVLLESPPDCARLLSVGVQGAVSSYGSEVTDAQMQLLFERCNHIVIAMDNDEAGWKSARMLRERYAGMGRRFSFYRYADSAKDPGEQSGADIRLGIESAISPLRVKFRLVA